MKRHPPNDSEVEFYVAYFREQLAPLRDLRQPNGHTEVSLSKKPSYFARRELQEVKTSEELLRWAEKWIVAEDWRRARDSVRALRYKSRNKLVRASMSHDTKKLLDARAKAYDLPLWRYLQCLELTPEKLQALEQASTLESTPVK